MGSIISLSSILDDLEERCKELSREYRKYDTFDDTLKRQIDTLINNINALHKEVKTKGVVSSNIPYPQSILNELTNKVVDLERTLGEMDESTKFCNKYSTLYVLMGRNGFYKAIKDYDSSFYTMCTSQHLGLVEAIEEKYKGRLQEIKAFYAKNPKSINVMETDKVNIELSTNYNPKFLITLFKIMQYEISSLAGLSAAIDNQWCKILSFIRGTKLHESEFISKGFRRQISVHTFYNFGIQLLMYIKFIGDGSKEHWPYIPITEEIIKYGEDLDISQNIINKLQMLGVNKYKNYDLKEALILSAIRQGILQTSFK